MEAREVGAEFVDLWGSGSASREFLYVDDCAEGLVLAAERLADSEPVNLGTGREISIADLAALVAKVCGYMGTLKFNPAKPDGQPRRSLDTQRAKQRLGFEAKTSLEDGLRKTVESFEAEQKTGEVREVDYK